MSEQVAVYDNGKAGMLETVLVRGDLSQLTAQQRLDYINEMCKVVGINPMSRPFQYITLSGRLTLYATRDCTDQIRKRDRISVTITARERMDDVYVVTARATLPDGRTDEAIGAVNIKGLAGEALANAMMKAETKAKRRVTLSIGGLGMLDETEVEDIPNVQPVVTVAKPQALPQGHTTTPERQALEDKARGLYNEAKRLGVAIPPAPGKTCTIPMLEQWIEDLADAIAAKA
jgi:hypothetical protein